MNNSIISVSLLLTCLVIAPVSARAQGSVVRKGITELVELFAESGAKQATREMAEIGGEKTVREVIEKAATQGGDELVAQVVSLGKNRGPRALKALEADPALMAKALQTVPDGKVADVVLEASRQPALMAKLVRTHGDEVLSASARHPGIGTQVIDDFGGAGLKATKELGTDDIVLLARTKGFKEMPEAAQRKFLGMLDRNPQSVTNFLKLAAGGTAIFMTADLVNKLEREVFGEAGKPGKLTQPMVTYAWIIGGVLVAGLVGYASIKLWGVWRHTKRHSGS